jgi:hypothetical protein
MRWRRGGFECFCGSAARCLEVSIWSDVEFCGAAAVTAVGEVIFIDGVAVSWRLRWLSVAIGNDVDCYGCIDRCARLVLIACVAVEILECNKPKFC